MSRVPQSAGSKGSQRWMQQLVEKNPEVLDAAIGRGKITWRSPLRADDFAEYRDEEALSLLGIQPAKRLLKDFWPRQGPQWDALGLTSSGEPVLVEAKAHVAELFSGATQATGESLNLIKCTLDDVAAKVGAAPGLDWSQRFYQYANRLAFGYFLNVVNEIPSRIVFLHFMGDADIGGPRSHDEWAAALAVLHEAMGLRGRLPSYVTEAFVDVHALDLAGDAVIKLR